MVKLTRNLSKLTDIFVLQCNTEADIGRSDPHQSQKAAVEYAVKTLQNNGFPNTQVINPLGYTRPLVIGRKAQPSSLDRLC